MSDEKHDNHEPSHLSVAKLFEKIKHDYKSKPDVVDKCRKVIESLAGGVCSPQFADKYLRKIVESAKLEKQEHSHDTKQQMAAAHLRSAGELADRGALKRAYEEAHKAQLCLMDAIAEQLAKTLKRV